MSASGTRHSGLGRGLASLIPARTATLAAPTEIPLGRIRANPYQPRRHMEEQALRDLAASIAEHGVLQPVLVTETLDGYQLIAGERRLRAAEMAGLDRIPALVRQLAGEEQLELALVENIQRADLNPLEEAGAYRQLIGEFGLSQDEVARRVGRARSSVANTLRLLELAPAVQGAIRDETISEGHGRALASVDAPAQQEALLAAIVARGLSVRQTEELARRLKDRLTAPPAPKGPVPPELDPDPELERIEADLRTALGTKVTLTRSRAGGRIVIDFYGDEELARILERLLASPS
jgi:ParB family chromosome partitioning protein